MAYIPQIIALNDTAYNQTNSWRLIPYNYLQGASFPVFSGGTGYISGDVGKTLTMTPPAGMIADTPATLTIASVSGGHVTAFEPSVYTGVWQGNSGPATPTPLTGSTTGSGAETQIYPIPAPFLFSANAGLPTSFNSLTINMVCDVNGSACPLSSTYVVIEPNVNPCSVTLYDASDAVIFSGTFGTGATNGAHSHTISFDTTTQVIQYFIDGVQQTMVSGTWHSTNAVNNDSRAHWSIGNIFFQPEPCGFGSLYLNDVFTDLTVSANLEQFVPSGGGYADPSLLATAPTNMYLRMGDAPSAMSANYGGTGTWVFVDGGEGERFNQGWFSAVPLHYLQIPTPGVSLTTPFNTSISGSLAADALNLRPGGFVIFSVETPPTNGTLSLAPNGSFTYTPDIGFTGSEAIVVLCTDTMPPGYDQPFGYQLDSSPFADAPSGPFTGTINLGIAVEAPDILELVMLWPMQADASEFAIQNIGGANFPTTFSQMTLSMWCCQNVTIAAANGVDPPYSVLMAFTPTGASIQLADNLGNPLFSGTFINPVPATDQYHIMFSVDTEAQTFTLWGASGQNAVEWTSGDVTWGSPGSIGNGETLAWYNVNGGSWYPTGDPATNTGGANISAGVGPLLAYGGISTDVYGGSLTFNLSGPFTYTVPAGYAGPGGTLNPSDAASELTLSGGDLIMTLGGEDGPYAARGTATITTGSYFEVTASSAAYNFAAGVANASASLSPSPESGQWPYANQANMSGGNTPGYSNVNGTATLTACDWLDSTTLGVAIGGNPSNWTISSSLVSPAEGGVGNVWLDNSYVNFNDATTRGNFSGTTGAWVDPGYYGESYTGTSPDNFLTIQYGNSPDDITFNYGQSGGASSWQQLNVGNDPTTGIPYPADFVIDTCVPPAGAPQCMEPIFQPNPCVIIPSYLYDQYTDDSTCQVFVNAFNIMQTWVQAWWCNIALPYWPTLSGLLLDWIGAGLYGYPRPILSYQQTVDIGGYNTAPYNTTPYNSASQISNSTLIPVNDDIYRRMLTWHLYLGDGWQFTTRWLKQRVHRFLNGQNGFLCINDNTDDVSVTFSGRTITITLNYSPVAQIFQYAVMDGVLALPLEYTFVVSLSGFSPPAGLPAIRGLAIADGQASAGMIQQGGGYTWT